MGQFVAVKAAQTASTKKVCADARIRHHIVWNSVNILAPLPLALAFALAIALDESTSCRIDLDAVDGSVQAPHPLIQVMVVI